MTTTESQADTYEHDSRPAPEGMLCGYQVAAEWAYHDCGAPAAAVVTTRARSPISGLSAGNDAPLCDKHLQDRTTELAALGETVRQVGWPRYVDSNGEHWAPVDHTEYGLGWLRCEETDRGVRYIESVAAEFGPLAEAIPAGTPVRYWKGFREGEGKIGRTRTAVQFLAGHTPVVWVEGESSCIAMTHVERVAQP